MTSRRGAIAVGAAVMVALAILIGIASADNRPAPPRRIALFGDSLTFEALRYWKALFEASPRLDQRTTGAPGAAICDLFGPMERVKREYDPDVVAFQFVGNDIFKCMRNPDGSQLSKPEYLRRWRAYTKHAIGLFSPSTPIYLVGAPEMVTHDNRVYDIFRDLARDYPNTHFVDGGRLVTPHRTWVGTLPCEPNEPCTGPTVDGVRTNDVRNVDKIHFCPIEHQFGTQCPVYSSGANRFAVTLYEGIIGQRAPVLDWSGAPTTTTTVTPTTRTGG